MTKTTIKCDSETISLLNKVIEKKIKNSMTDGTFDIMQLVKSKKGISYNKAIRWICNILIIFEDEYEKATPKEKVILNKLYKHIKRDKMNSIA